MISILAYSIGFFVVMSALVGGLGFWVTRRWRTSPAARSLTQRILLVLGMLVVMHFVFDLVFLGFVQSDGFGRSVSAQLWKHRHWHPINSQGYRDREHLPEHFVGKRVLAVVGDSFVAGHGIDDAEDRFANVLGGMLAGQGWETVVLAQNGWGPDQELEALQAFEPDPDVIVLSYYANDIQPACEELISPSPGRLARYAGGIASLHIRKSPFASYVYWRLARMQSGLVDDYRAWLKACRASAGVVALHRQQLDAIRAAAQQRRAELIVLVIPSLLDAQGSREALEPAFEWIRDESIAHVDLAQHIADRDPTEIVVNELDAHANAALNHEIAGLLYAEIESNVDLGPPSSSTD